MAESDLMIIVAVKIDDTVPDIGEGLNTGMWTIGLAVCGNEFGMTPDDVRFMNEKDFKHKREKVYSKLRQAGAHYMVDSIVDAPLALEAIQKARSTRRTALNFDIRILFLDFLSISQAQGF